MLTQLARVGEARKVEIHGATMIVTPSFVMSGSMLAGTAAHRLESMHTSIDVTSEADPDTIAAIVDQAERMCFVLDAIERSHTVERTATHNGRPLPST